MESVLAILPLKEEIQTQKVVFLKYFVLCLVFGNVVDPVSSQTSDKCSIFRDVTLAYGDGKCITLQ